MKIIKFNVGKVNAYVKAYIHDDLTGDGGFIKSRPAIVICPGGGYSYVSPREADPVAMPLFVAGYQIFILYYSVEEDIKKSSPESEAAEALRTIRERSVEFAVDSSRIAIMGFSAGGHVAASLLCHYERYGAISRPDLGILAYPVITTGEGSHQGSVRWITNDFDESLMRYYSLEKEVSVNTPPCFIWHTAEDQTVPICNSFSFVKALLDNNVSVEYHIYPKGKHGLSIANTEVGSEEKEVQSWMDLLQNWLSLMFDFTI